MAGHAHVLASEPPVVARVGHYQVLRRLGLGKSSEVLLAAARGPFEFERIVAIKRLLPGAFVDEMRQRRFAREAVAYARLEHPAIVRLYDVVAEHGELALVLEHVEGTSLRRLLASLAVTGERLEDEAAAFVGTRIFAALEAAHAARDPRTGARTPVIHRDVTPGNVLVPWNGFAKLADFGIAKVTGLPGDTRLGVMKGTYGYMAPEQVLGDPVTVLTDVYQASLVLYELFSGRPAFPRAARAEIELLHAMAECQIVPLELSRPDLPAPIVDAIRRGLRHDPAQRTITPAEMVQLLRSQLDVERGRASLVRVLARLRPYEQDAAYVEPSSTPRHSIDPWALNVLRASSRPPPAPPPDPEPRPRPRPRSKAAPRVTLFAVALFAACATAFVLAFFFAFAWKKQAVAPPPPPRPRVAPPPPAPDPAPTWTAKPKAVPPPTGLVATPASAAGHRVFVDGRAVCAGAKPCEVRCGRRIVRIGSQGRPHDVDVPCGGEIAIDR